MILGNEKISIEEISKSLEEANGYPVGMVKNNIMANVAVSLTITNNIRKEMNTIYEKDKRKYYEAAKNSTGYEHIIITMGNIEQEIYAKRALGIIICAEEDSQLRSKIIKIIRKYYPEVYQAIKNGNRRLLIEKYSYVYARRLITMPRRSESVPASRQDGLVDVRRMSIRLRGSGGRSAAEYLQLFTLRRKHAHGIRHQHLLCKASTLAL